VSDPKAAPSEAFLRIGAALREKLDE